MANSYTSSVKIPLSECQKYRYGHTIGGTMHSRSYFKAKKMKQAQSLAKYSLDEAEKMIAARYGEIAFDAFSITTVGCNVLYKASSEKHHYYLDAATLAIVSEQEK